MENAKQKAFACAADGAYQQGLTKREYFAAMAMQGLLASGDWLLNYSELAKDISLKSVEIADEMLKHLDD